MSNQEIPPWLREQLARFEQLQQSLQVTSSQKQQIELEIAEMNKAVEELTKSGQDETVYKSVGTVLIKSKKEDVLKEIEEKKELAQLFLRPWLYIPQIEKWNTRNICGWERSLDFPYFFRMKIILIMMNSIMMF